MAEPDSYLDRVPGFVEFHLIKGQLPRRRSHNEIPSTSACPVALTAQRLIARKDTETDVALEGRLSQSLTSNRATTRSIRRNGPTAILNGGDVNTLKIAAQNARSRP